MPSAAKIARRTFLVGSVAIAGGVAFGVYQARKPTDNPLGHGLEPGEATFNPWVKISASSVTLIAPHTDLGQGARSIQALLIAEEMDLAWGQFSVEPGEPAQAYYNTAAAAEAVPFLPGDTSWKAGAARSTVDALAKIIGLQATGGSTTVADSFDKLRMAGAVARETLKHAASRLTGVAVKDLRTDQGAVVAPDGRRYSYLQLAADAANIEPVEVDALRDPGQWRLIGKPMPRLDIADKSTGKLRYGIDIRLDGMVHATVRFNPRQGGKLNSYDASAVKDVPGIRKVLEVTNGVAVVANNTWTAFQAANAITFDWAAADYHPAMDRHWDELSGSFTDERLDETWTDSGNVDAGIAGAAHKFEAEYRVPYLAHQPLEPLSAVISVGDDRADIWVAHQMPRIAQGIAADILGLPTDRVFLHNQYAGGSFGHRLEFENIRYAAEVGKAMRGTPVKLTFSREEDFAHDFPRQIAMGRVRGAVKDGRIEALDVAVAGPPILASQMERAGLQAAGADTQLPAGIWNAPYSFNNWRVRTYLAPKLAPVSSWRSVGASHGGFFLETALDELIHLAGGDPLEERLRLVNSKAALKVLETVGEMSNWGAPLGQGQGRGLAFVQSFGTPVAEVVDVTSTPEGIRIDKVYVAADVGKVLDPVNFENLVMGGVIWGLGHAMNCEVTYADGMAEQTNFHDYQAMRMWQCPDIAVKAVESGKSVSGIGEPPVPPAAPALGNAVFAATGKRMREMPFSKFVQFV